MRDLRRSPGIVLLCMTLEDRSEWERLDRVFDAHRGPDEVPGSLRLPCVDCTSEFAEEMLAVNLCVGKPGMSESPRRPSIVHRGDRGVNKVSEEIRHARRIASWRAYRARTRAKP